MFENPEAIIFDLGGVIYHIDTRLSADAFRRLGVKNFEKLYSLAGQAHLFDLLEMGKITAHDFVKRINEYAGVPLTDEAIIRAWNALLIGIPENYIELLAELRSRYRVFLLSNTNIIHLEEINRYVNQHFGRPGLDVFFDKAYYSFECGMRKPDLKIYRKVMDEQGLTPERTLFIDDNEANVTAARSLGIHAVLKDRDVPLDITMLHTGIQLGAG